MPRQRCWTFGCVHGTGGKHLCVLVVGKGPAAGTAKPERNGVLGNTTSPANDASQPAVPSRAIDWHTSVTLCPGPNLPMRIPSHTVPHAPAWKISSTPTPAAGSSPFPASVNRSPPSAPERVPQSKLTIQAPRPFLSYAANTWDASHIKQDVSDCQSRPVLVQCRNRTSTVQKHKLLAQDGVHRAASMV